MDTAKQVDIITHIVKPRREGAAVFLNELGLVGHPPQEQVYQDIESKLLLPPTGFPKHLLPTYQVYDDNLPK